MSPHRSSEGSNLSTPQLFKTAEELWSLNNLQPGVRLVLTSRAATQSPSSEVEHGIDAAEDDERPNKYHGPAKTWANWTEEERTLAASLAQITAGDLSIHLYNAHKLKQRLRRPVPLRELKAWHSKKQWIDERNKKAWYPDTSWTAWPLENQDVPRPEEKFGRAWDDEDEQWTIRDATSALKPSQVLEDLLVAVVLKRAKEKLNGRLAALDTESRGKGAAVDDIPKESEQSPMSHADDSAEHGRSGESEPDDNRKEEEQDDENGLTDHGHEEEPQLMHQQQEILEGPEVMADDEEARHILMPTIRSILSRFDNMLAGLHFARLPHSYKARSSKRSQMGRVPDRARIATSGSNINPSPSQSRSTSRPASTSSASDQTATSDSGSSESHGKLPTAEAFNTPTRSRRRPPRDWSEVLGVASMRGWDLPALQRTTQLCADLFEESLSFVTLDECPAGTSTVAPVVYKPQSIPAFSHQGYVANPSLGDHCAGPRFRISPGSLYCPYPDCYRHNISYPAFHRLTQHMRRTHHYDPEEEEEEMYGGVHVDGFLQPVESIRGRRNRNISKRKASDAAGDGDATTKNGSKFRKQDKQKT